MPDPMFLEHHRRGSGCASEVARLGGQVDKLRRQPDRSDARRRQTS